jgi:hypothetical protein
MFQKPSAEAPHAMVTLQLLYRTRPGPYVKDIIKVNRLSVIVPDGKPHLRSTSGAIRVPLGPGQWRVATDFYHTTQHTGHLSVPRTRTVYHASGTRTETPCELKLATTTGPVSGTVIVES